MAPAHSKPLLDACFRKEEVLLILPILFNILSQIVGMKRRIAVIARTFIWSEEHFRGPVLWTAPFLLLWFCWSLCFLVVVVLLLLLLFSPQEKLAGNGTRREENKGHANPSWHSRRSKLQRSTASFSVHDTRYVFMFERDFHRLGFKKLNTTPKNTKINASKSLTSQQMSIDWEEKKSTQYIN